jgi:hypothetical protein
MMYSVHLIDEHCPPLVFPIQAAQLSVVLPAHFAARSLAQRGSITKGLNVCIVAAASATRESSVGP